MNFNKLKAFRRAAYQHLCRAHDATFELTDAILLTRHAYSLADLSLCPVFRRQWPSIYEALEDCRPSRQKLMKLYIEQIPTDVRPKSGNRSYQLVTTRCGDATRADY